MAAAHAELESIRASLEYYEGEVFEMARKSESLIADETIRQGIGEFQAAGIQIELLKMRVSHLELRYRYNRLLARLELFLGGQVTETAY